MATGGPGFMPRSCISKIVWSVDAFENAETGSVQKQTAEALCPLVAKTQSSIEPVYVLNPDQLNLGSEVSSAWLEQYRPAAENGLKAILEKLGPQLTKAGCTVGKPQVLVHSASSTASAVKALAVHAEKVGADIIAVGTHGRKGMPRFFLGSFAESLLLYSKVPVLVVNPKAQVPNQYDTIIFPTDLSRESRTLFRRVVLLARDLKAKLVVYHSVQNPLGPVLRSGVQMMGGEWVPASDYMDEEIIRRRKSALHWVNVASKLEVEVELVVELGQKGVASGILETAQKKNSKLIAMAAQSGPIASTVIGSVCRQVVREAPCPVWVLRAERNARSRTIRK